MKSISITLLQSADNPDVFVVTRLVNTVQIAIGQRFTREKVAAWTTLDRVSVTVAGVEQIDKADSDLLNDKPQPAIERVNSIALLNKASA